VGEALATKYNMDQDNRQRVVSVTNLVTYEQVGTASGQLLKHNRSWHLVRTCAPAPAACVTCHAWVTVVQVWHVCGGAECRSRQGIELCVNTIWVTIPSSTKQYQILPYFACCTCSVQVWYNEVRSRKPQTFKAGGSGVVDPTGDGGVGKCDFCDWGRLTAQVRK
jgi:hypothetical protein